MTADESKHLETGQRVAWNKSITDLGTVKAADWSGVQIAWDSGSEQFLHHNNMAEVAVSKSKSK